MDHSIINTQQRTVQGSTIVVQEVNFIIVVTAILRYFLLSFWVITTCLVEYFVKWTKNFGELFWYLPGCPFGGVFFFYLANL
jgi:hypothetical protein